MCSTAVRPMRAPRCFGSAAMAVSASAAGGLNEQIVDDGLVLERDRADRRRQGEDDVIIGNRQKLRLALGEPLPRRRALTLGAVTVAAGIVGDAFVRAVLAALDVSAERRGPDRSRSPTSPSTGQDSDGQRWPCATPRHGRERRRRPPGEAAPCGVGQAGEDRLARLRPSRSSGLLMSRIVWTATRV